MQDPVEFDKIVSSFYGDCYYKTTLEEIKQTEALNVLYLYSKLSK